MTKSRRVLMASSDEVVNAIFRKVIEGGGHHLTVIDSWSDAGPLLEQARTSQYDLVIVTNLGAPLGYSLGLIASLRQACKAKVIVMSGAWEPDDYRMAMKEGASACYALPISIEQLRKAVEATARV